MCRISHSSVCLLLCCLLLACCLDSLAAQKADRPAGRPKFPSYDGTQNNAQHPQWGSTLSPYIRKQVPVAAYGPGAAGASNDGLAGANRPSPRAITVGLLRKPYFKSTSATNTSYLLTALGQLVSHDITRGLSTAASNGGEAPIRVPPGDPLFWRFVNETPTAQGARTSLPYYRTNFTRLTPYGPREQVNEASAWLDAAVIYGEHAKLAKIIRAGSAGRLAMDENKLLPMNLDDSTGQAKYTMKNLGQRVAQTQLRLSGNTNVNQNPMVMSLVTVMVLLHNRRARLVEADKPDWGDEEIYHEARKWVIGHFQRIALVDYLSALGIALPPYKGYNSSLDPSIDAFFSTVAYRYGHSTINDVVLRLDESWETHPKGHLPLRGSAYSPGMMLEAGLEPLIRGMLAQPQGRVEPRWATAISGNWLGDALINGTDLAAINIQRGRDHGIPDYNTCRRALGLPAAKTFADITPDAEVAAALKDLYGNVNNIDAYVGGLSEPHEGTNHLGPLFTASIKEQFARLRDADWWYYENGANNKLYTEAEIKEIQGTSLRNILERTTSIKDLPEDIWTASSGGMACAAGSSISGGNKGGGVGKLLLPDLLSRSASLQVEPSQQEGWVKVLLTSTGSGWLGFGVADPGSSAAMIGADMVVGRMADGVPQVLRYRATDHQPPGVVSTTDDRLKVIKFEQSGGRVLMEFERPNSAGDDGRAMLMDKPTRLIVARGPSNSIASIDGYHGGTNREIVELKNGLFGSASMVAADPKAITKRKAHGLLMAINFIVIFPLGALAARQLRSHWLRSPAIRASLFYVHIATQVAGTACVTAGFVIAAKEFKVPYKMVEFSHGQLGIAILALVYSQLLLGFLRPVATAPTMRRQAWDLAHSTLGRAAMIIGLANVALGITIFSRQYRGNFSIWAGLCGAGLGLITLLQYIMDRQEKYAVLKNDREMALLAAAQEDDDEGFDDDGLNHKPSGPVSMSGPQNSLDAAAAAQGDLGAFGAAAATGAAAGAGAGAVGGARSPKLTATLLEKHQASSGGDSKDVGISHPDFSPHGLQPGDVERTGWGQSGGLLGPQAAAGGVQSGLTPGAPAAAGAGAGAHGLGGPAGGPYGAGAYPTGPVPNGYSTGPTAGFGDPPGFGGFNTRQ